MPEYEQMIEYSKDVYGQRKALWELYYLSGVRPEELGLRVEDGKEYFPSIDDVRVLEDGNVEFIVRKSKTQPRKIPLPEYPDNLIRYIGNHPDRKNMDAPLFFNLKSEIPLSAISEHGIYEAFKRMRTALNLKKTLNLKSFRKTRATIYFNHTNLTDKKIGKIFGWTTITVAQRRDEYDLSDYDDLKKDVFSSPVVDKSYDAILKEKQTLEEKHEKEISHLKTQFELMKNALKDVTEGMGEELEERIKQKEAYKEYQRTAHPSEKRPLPDKIKKEIDNAGGMKNWSKKKLAEHKTKTNRRTSNR